MLTQNAASFQLFWGVGGSAKEVYDGMNKFGVEGQCWDKDTYVIP